MTTDILENALAFAASEEHSGDANVILNQALCACRTLAREVTRLQRDVDCHKAGSLVGEMTAGDVYG